MGNKKWAIQRNWQHDKTKKNKTVIFTVPKYNNIMVETKSIPLTLKYMIVHFPNLAQTLH
jgi:hypothetical protein